MMKKLLFAAVAFALLVSCSPKLEKVENDEYRVCAFIWPSCHDDSLGRANWEEGIGEWEVIKKGNPRFEGHYQPKVPMWGYEMDNDPVVVERWIQTALAHGVNTFVYDWYWFEHYPYLESALNDGFLKAPSNEKMDFFIMWANHDVKHNYWNYHKWQDDESILWSGVIDPADWPVIVNRIITQYFHRPNYTKIDGCPVFAIFDVYNFINSFFEGVFTGFQGDFFCGFFAAEHIGYKRIERTAFNCSGYFCGDFAVFNFCIQADLREALGCPENRFSDQT